MLCQSECTIVCRNSAQLRPPAQSPSHNTGPLPSLATPLYHRIHSPLPSTIPAHSSPPPPSSSPPPSVIPAKAGTQTPVSPTHQPRKAPEGPPSSPPPSVIPAKAGTQTLVSTTIQPRKAHEGPLSFPRPPSSPRKRGPRPSSPQATNPVRPTKGHHHSPTLRHPRESGDPDPRLHNPPTTVGMKVGTHIFETTPSAIANPILCILFIHVSNPPLAKPNATLYDTSQWNRTNVSIQAPHSNVAGTPVVPRSCRQQTPEAAETSKNGVFARN